MGKLKESNLENQEKTAALYTDSLITLDSLKNMNNHNAIIEGICSSLRILEAEGWNIQFSWVKAHVGILDNELADHLAKQAAEDENLQICYSRIPLSVVESELMQLSVRKWETEWSLCTKGDVTKSFFPSMKERLAQKISITPNLSTIVTGHGRLRTYFI